MNIIRVAGLGLLAAVLLVLIFRYHVTRAPSDHPLSQFAGLFPGHPDLLRRSLELTAATAAREGRSLTEEDLEKSRRLFTARPLATMPLLIAGAEAQLRGDEIRAHSLYLAVRDRNPRLPAPRLLLADSYLRRGDAERGIAEVLALTRITPRSAAPAVAALVTYAKDPAAAKRLDRALAPYPELRSGILKQLATDPSNIDSILILAPADAVDRPWEGILLNALVSEDQPRKAFGLWRRFSKTGYEPGGIVNPAFEAWSAPPPFNWQLPTTAAGLAELRPSKGLAVIYYGRDNATFAKQLLLLPPGRHGVRTALDGTGGSSGLKWSLRCTNGDLIDEWAIEEPAEISVPANCDAQRFELIGRPTDQPQNREVIISRVGVAWLGK